MQMMEKRILIFTLLTVLAYAKGFCETCTENKRLHRETVPIGEEKKVHGKEAFGAIESYRKKAQSNPIATYSVKKEHLSLIVPRQKQERINDSANSHLNQKKISENPNEPVPWELYDPNIKKHSSLNVKQRKESEARKRNSLCLYCKNHMTDTELKLGLLLNFNYAHAACVFHFYPNFIASNRIPETNVKQCMMDFLKELVDNNDSQQLKKLLEFAVSTSWSNQMLDDLEIYFLESIQNRHHQMAIRDLMNVFIEMRLSGNRPYDIATLRKFYYYAYGSGNFFMFEFLHHRELHQGKILLMRLIERFPAQTLPLLVNFGHVRLRNSKECERVLMKLLEKTYENPNPHLLFLFRILNEIHSVFKLLCLMERLKEGYLINPWESIHKIFFDEDITAFEIIRAIEIGMTFLVGKAGHQFKPFQGTMWTVYNVCIFLGQKININLQNYVIALSLSDSAQLRAVKGYLATNSFYNQQHYKDTIFEAIQALERTTATHLRFVDNNRDKRWNFIRKPRQECIKAFLEEKSLSSQQ